MLGGDVGVLHLVGLGLGGLERRLRLSGEAYLGVAVHGAEALQPPLQFRPDGGMACADALQYGHGQARVLVQKGYRQMLRLHLGVSALLGQLLSGGERFLGLEREPFQLHVLPTPRNRESDAPGIRACGYQSFCEENLI